MLVISYEKSKQIFVLNPLGVSLHQNTIIIIY